MAKKPNIGVDEDIVIDSRGIAHVMANAIRDVYDALVELIKNSDDSYHKLFRDNRRPQDGGDILIEIRKRNQPNASLVIVKDKAAGMTYSGMREKVRVWGERMSGEGGHGFMGRGLKDCCALGNIQVESVIEDKYHACKIYSVGGTLKFRGLADGKRVNQAQRDKLGVSRGSGTMVTLTLRPSVKVPQHDTLARLLPMHYALRGIASPNGKIGASQIFLRGADGRKRKLAMSPISGDKVVDVSFGIDGYPKAECFLQIWKSQESLGDSDLPLKRMRRSGVVIRACRSFHDCTLSPQYETDNLAKHYFGVLRCDYIQKLLEESDKLRQRNEDSADNPRPLVPSARHGLDYSHPFAEALLNKIREQLKLLVDKDRQGGEQGRGDIADSDMRRRLARLAREMNKFLKGGDEDGLTTAEKTAIDNALETGCYILPTGFAVGIGQRKTLTAYVNCNSWNSQQATVRSDNQGVVAAVPAFSLKPHWHDSRVASGSFDVRGVALGRATIHIGFGEILNARVDGVVRKKEAVLGPDLVADLEFERPQYKIAEGKRKSIQIFAKNVVVPKSGAVAHVVCSSPAAVIVSGRQLCRLSRVPGANYAKGKIEVEGRNITPRSKPARITAQLKGGGTVTAQTNVRVVEQRAAGGDYRVELVDKSLGELRARWGDLDGKPHLLEISAIHPSIKHCFGSPPDFPLKKSPQSWAVQAEIIAEYVCWQKLRNEARDHPEKFPVEARTPREITDDMELLLQKNISVFSQLAHKILSGEL